LKDTKIPAKNIMSNLPGLYIHLINNIQIIEDYDGIYREYFSILNKSDINHLENKFNIEIFNDIYKKEEEEEKKEPKDIKEPEYIKEVGKKDFEIIGRNLEQIIPLLTYNQLTLISNMLLAFKAENKFNIEIFHQLPLLSNMLLALKTKNKFNIKIFNDIYEKEEEEKKEPEDIKESEDIKELEKKDFEIIFQNVEQITPLLTYYQLKLISNMSQIFKAKNELKIQKINENYLKIINNEN
jgi:hypothetical protein